MFPPKTKRKETFDGLVTFLRFRLFGVVFYNLVAPAVNWKQRCRVTCREVTAFGWIPIIISSDSRRLRLLGIRSRQSLVAAQLKDEPDFGVQWHG